MSRLARIRSLCCKQVFKHDAHLGNHVVRRLVAEVDQVLAVRMIVVLFFFGARIVEMLDLDFQSNAAAASRTLSASSSMV